MSPADFHRLERRLRMIGTLVTRTGLRIGSGGGGSLDGANLPVLRDRDGYPFLPGGSLKGSLRSTIEALLRGAGLPRSTGLWACDPHDETACGWHASNGRTAAEDKIGQSCAACRLFGSHVLASHVRFTDARVSDEQRQGGQVPIEIRDSVAIDRDLRTAVSGRKYDFEVVSPGTAFDVEVFVENPHDWSMGLLALGFEQLDAGFTALGGFGSRGLGRVEFRWTSIVECTARDLLKGQPGIPQDPEERQRAWRDALARRGEELT
jgi:CRISPR-associated RAMP protein (TIGR02581 family)